MKKTIVQCAFTVVFFVGVFMTIPALVRQENSQASQQKEEPAASHDKEAHDTTSQNDSKQPPADALGERDANESEASGTSPSKSGFTIIYDKDGNQVTVHDKYGNEIPSEEVADEQDNGGSTAPYN